MYNALNASNTELATQLVNARKELARTVCDRDRIHGSVQYWMDSSTATQAARNKAEAKVVKLRTFLQRAEHYDTTFMYVDIKRVLEETK
jgi:hypothetical protein